MFASIDFTAPAPTVAQHLIGTILLVDGIGGRIVETEAYDRDDPASHSHAGITSRNRAMFGEPGHLYVYRSYGLHWCLNFVCQKPGHGAAVLIRAIEPLEGLDVMRARRHLEPVQLLCAGPGRLTQALGITHAHNGLPLNAAPFLLKQNQNSFTCICGPRIGISKAVDMPWRFGLAGSKFLSRPFK